MVGVHPSNEFKGIGFDYNQNEQPFFKAIVKENLRKLKQLPTGKQILSEIAKASPAKRAGFPAGVNVVIQPPHSRTYSAPGLTGGQGSFKIGDQAAYDTWYQGKKGRLMPSINAKVSAAGCDEKNGSLSETGKLGCGCACWLYFSNNEILAKDGNWLVPHITLGHELIHCLHYLIGAAETDNKKEEYQTVGIKGYHNMPFTENKLRVEAGIKPRTKYFSDD